MDAILESSEDKVKTFAQRTNGLTLGLIFTANKLPPAQCTIDYGDKFFVYYVFFFFIVKQFVSCNGLAYILCSNSHISDRVHCHLVCIVLF